MSTYQLSEDQVGSLQRDYPSVAMQTEGGGVSFAPPTPEGDRRSGYAFGLYQFDAGTNPSADVFLSKNVFENNQDLLTALVHNTASASQVAAADQMLQSAMQNQSVNAAYNQLVQAQTQTMVDVLQNIINNVAVTDPAVAQQILSDQNLQLQIMDFANQYRPGLAEKELAPPTRCKSA